ncbi:HK97 family phage prohead protease [Paenarthrobacter ilicis]|uniref:HK97 family phage prohead protease n=1 Tax=Paenarthrobacter ilicis TaxID=43665 RepID=UPI003864E5CE
MITEEMLTGESGLVQREIQIRAAASEAREFTGIGVPWNDPITIRSWFGEFTEEFERGAIVESDGAKVFYRHGEIIGHLLSNRDTDAGWEITGHIAETRLGNDAYALLRAGSIDRLSIGFQPIEWREDEDGHITYTKVRVLEVSLVPHPAYDSAKISEVRHASPQNAPKGNTMIPETLTRADLTPLEEGMEDLRRSVSLLGTRSTGPAIPEFRSMGEFLKAIAAGDQDAADFHRAYTGATTDDTIMKDSFVGDFIRLVTERRRIVNQFSRGTLPADGLSVDYYQLDSDDTKVEKQANEGDDLPFGKIVLKKANSEVDTFGGATELTRQAIERATRPALDVTLRALGLRYGRVTNAAVAAVYKAQIAAKLTEDATDPNAAVDLSAGATATEWLNMIVDAALLYEERGYEIGGLNVSANVFKTLNGLKDGDQRLMRVYGDGQNQVGELNLSQVKGNLAGVTVSLLPNTTGNVASFYDPLAIETLESPGAPAQLQDENIINLSKQFSVYGYQAIIVPFPDAIVPVKFGA